MAQYKAFSPDAEINGESILLIVNGMGAFRETAIKMLAEKGIQRIQPEKWYLQQAFLDALMAVAEKVGEEILFSAGKTFSNQLNWPRQINTPEKALAYIDVAYRLNHRGREIGSYRYDKTGAESGKMVCTNPYPSEFDRGLILGVLRKFAPEGSTAFVMLDEKVPGRKQGAESCTFLVFW